MKTKKVWNKMNPPTRAKAVKKRPAKMSDNPIIAKLLKLKYHINDTYHNSSKKVDKADKNYVMSLISDIRKHGFTKLAPEDAHCCNGLWRKYEG